MPYATPWLRWCSRLRRKKSEYQMFCRFSLAMRIVYVQIKGFGLRVLCLPAVWSRLTPWFECCGNRPCRCPRCILSMGRQPKASRLHFSSSWVSPRHSVWSRCCRSRPGRLGPCARSTCWGRWQGQWTRPRSSWGRLLPD